MSNTTATRERPILFSGPMVRAILDGRKTQTRRVVKAIGPQEITATTAYWYDATADLSRNNQQFARDCCPFGKVGDRLWVRETWAPCAEPENHEHAKAGYTYRADWSDEDEEIRDFDWKPSIFMRREASRITLEVLSVRVERAHQITDADVRAEGVSKEAIDQWRKWLHPNDVHGHAFGVLWDSINGKSHPWASNPWVWVVEFKRIDEARQ